MSSFRKKLFGLILLALVVLSIVFWGTLFGVCCLIGLIYTPQIYLYNRVSSAELAKTFQEDGKHVKGWRD